MSQLVAVVYDTPEIARAAADRLRAEGPGQTIQMRDLVIAVRSEDGTVKLDQSVDLIAGGVLGGAFWGSLIGLLFLNPLFGAVGGAAGGAVAGWFADYGIDDDFMREIAQRLVPGKAALFVLAEHLTIDKIAPVLARDPGSLLYSSLSVEADARLTEALARPAPAISSTGPAASEAAE